MQNTLYYNIKTPFLSTKKKPRRRWK